MTFLFHSISIPRLIIVFPEATVNMSNPTVSPKIALVGAGPASLALAAILHRHGLCPVIYESSPTLRHQGGTLDLHPQTGQQALRDAGLWAQFVQHARPESDVLKLVDLITGQVFWDENGEEKKEVAGKTKEEMLQGRPEIDRGKLMEILAAAVPDDRLRWGRKVAEVVPQQGSDKKYEVVFADGTRESGFDLVVGGDGAWSKVRNLLTDKKPHYSGITCVEVWHTDVQKDPWLLEYVGAGSCFAFGADHAVLSQRQGDGSQRTYACLRAPETFIQECGIDWSNKDAARSQFLDRYFAHVFPDLRRLVASSPDHLTPRVLYELPIGFAWESRPGVTLIGDAAHLMTPFAGVGVNVGLTDALMLAREILAASKGLKSLDEATKAYEAEMWPRAKKFMEKTEKNKRTHFKEGGSKDMAEMLKGFHASMAHSSEAALS